MDEHASGTSKQPLADKAAGGPPSDVQRRWLERGLSQAGGKLPLFDRNGKRVSDRTVRSCLEKGWCEPWFANPTKPDWLVCRLTDQGRQVLTANDAH
ncbi:MAG: hypothetical protein RIB59_10310 [Rhodospirillales bacterium]